MWQKDNPKEGHQQSHGLREPEKSNHAECANPLGDQVASLINLAWTEPSGDPPPEGTGENPRKPAENWQGGVRQAPRRKFPLLPLKPPKRALKV